MPYNNPHIEGWLRVIIFIIAYLFFGLGFSILGRFVIGIELSGSFEEATDSQKLISLFIDSLAFLCVLWLSMKIIDKEPFLNLGLRLKNRGKDIITGILLGAVIMGLAFLILLAISQLKFSHVSFNFVNLLYLITLFTIVSFREELVFRGYFLRNLMYSFEKPIALTISAVLFSILHGLNPSFDHLAFINLFLAGIMLGLPYLYNKNLWLPIAFHFSWNFFQSLLGFNVSGLNSYSIITFKIPKENIINGGNFGFEGSVISIIIQIIVIVGLYIFYKKTSLNEQTITKQIDL